MTKAEKKEYDKARYIRLKSRIAGLNKAWHFAHKDQRNESAKAWRLENAKVVKVRTLARRYNLTLTEFDQYYRANGGRCWCCNKDMDQPHVDHDHVTNKIRGLLCPLCNRGIGCLGDTVNGLQKAVAYLNRSSTKEAHLER